MILSSLLLLAALAAAPPDRPTVATRVTTPARLTVGDRFDVALTVTAAKRSLITGPLAESLGVFVVADEKRSTKSGAKADESTYHLSVAGFKTGRQPVPVFTFVVQNGQAVDTLTSDTASVTIASVLPGQMKDIRGLKPPETFPNPWLWLIPAALLAALVLAWVARSLMRRLRRLREQAEAPLPPWEEALQALDSLPWREWLDAGQVKRYYFALSEVLKRYIERRFEFHAVEQTTTEMLASMRTYKTPMRDDIGRFLTRSDLVKYAKLVPPDDEATAAIAQVREFVMRTKPEPAPAASPATPGATPVAQGAG
jgi:hypothetical protein